MAKVKVAVWLLAVDLGVATRSDDVQRAALKILRERCPPRSSHSGDSKPETFEDVRNRVEAEIAENRNEVMRRHLKFTLLPNELLEQRQAEFNFVCRGVVAEIDEEIKDKSTTSSDGSDHPPRSGDKQPSARGNDVRGWGPATKKLIELIYDSGSQLRGELKKRSESANGLQHAVNSAIIEDFQNIAWRSYEMARAVALDLKEAMEITAGLFEHEFSGASPNDQLVKLLFDHLRMGLALDFVNTNYPKKAGSGRLNCPACQINAATSTPVTSTDSVGLGSPWWAFVLMSFDTVSLLVFGFGLFRVLRKGL